MWVWAARPGGAMGPLAWWGAAFAPRLFHMGPSRWTKGLVLGAAVKGIDGLRGATLYRQAVGAEQEERNSL